MCVAFAFGSRYTFVLSCQGRRSQESRKICVDFDRKEALSGGLASRHDNHPNPLGEPAGDQRQCGLWSHLNLTGNTQGDLENFLPGIREKESDSGNKNQLPEREVRAPVTLFPFSGVKRASRNSRKISSSEIFDNLDTFLC